MAILILHFTDIVAAVWSKCVSIIQAYSGNRQKRKRKQEETSQNYQQEQSEQKIEKR